MPARGRRKFKQKPRKGNKTARKSKKKYSLYPNKNEKRKLDQQEEVQKKRKKLEDEPVQNAEFPETSSEEEEEEDNDHLQKLLETFDPNILNKKSAAIESDEDDDSDNDHSEPNILDQNHSKLGSSDDYVEQIETGEQNIPSSKKTEGKNNIKTNLEDENEIRIEEEDEIDIETQKEDDNLNEDLEDPFSRHLLYDLDENFVNSLHNISNQSNIKTEMLEWKELGKIQVQIPKYDRQQKPNLKLSDTRPFASMGTVPKRIDQSKQSPESVFIKHQIKDNLLKANKFLKSDDASAFLTPLQCELFSIMNNYQDFYYPHRTLDNGEEIRFVYCLHALNHVLKTRTKILHHNAKLNQKDVTEEFRDQGLVRPKVLILVPFRDSAYKIVNFITNILLKEDKGNVINKIRFLEEFTGHELVLPKKNPKPEDYERTFTGNTGDEFKIGITITKKSIKLFSDFYSSDIIIASPLGLRTIIGAEGEAGRDFDFLASIELLILDQTEIFLVQNWDHLLHIFNHLHLQPKDSHGTDFSRVRTWTLNGWSKYYRQTIILSSVVVPEINSIFNKKCANYAGKIKTVNPVQFGTICQVYVPLPHVFQKFFTQNVVESVEDRFNFFTSKVLPQYTEALMRQTLIYTTNYFDYVRLRNYFKREDIGFVQICEYSKEGKVARARDMFFHGDARFLLYTERFHFFNRIRLKGIRHLVFYSPPTFPHFYYEMCNLMQEANMNRKIGSMSNMTVTVLYSKYDVNQLAAIVGTERAVKMVESDRSVHMLVTEGKDVSRGT